MRWASRGVVNFYSAGVVGNSRFVGLGPGGRRLIADFKAKKYPGFYIHTHMCLAYANNCLKKPPFKNF
jgi:hypothetical protein